MNKVTIRGSLRLYGLLLKFYPAGFRQEYGDEMAYVFSESLKDAHAEQGGTGITRLWGRTIVDVSKSLVIQHLEDRKGKDMMKSNNSNGTLQRSIVRVALVTAILLLIPLVAMLLTDTFNWGVFDFVITGALLFVAGFTFELMRKRTGNNVYRAAFAIAIATAALLFFSNMALGVIGSDNEPANAMYLGVIAIAIIGTVLARFQPRGMAWAMFAAALAQASTVAIALAFGMHHYPGSSVIEILAINGFFMTGWIVAGLLFRWASDTGFTLESNAAG